MAVCEHCGRTRNFFHDALGRLRPITCKCRERDSVPRDMWFPTECPRCHSPVWYRNGLRSSLWFEPTLARTRHKCIDETGGYTTQHEVLDLPDRSTVALADVSGVIACVVPIRDKPRVRAACVLCDDDKLRVLVLAPDSRLVPGYKAMVTRDPPAWGGLWVMRTTGLRELHLSSQTERELLFALTVEASWTLGRVRIAEHLSSLRH